MRLSESALALCMLICMAIEPANSLSGDDDSNVLPPLSHTSFCIRYPDDCARTESTAALPASLDGRWRKMKLVNDSVNAAIAPKAKPDRFHAHWAIRPLEGDCNDFSVTKRHELLNAGWPSSSLLLAEVRLISTGEHHLILIVRGHRADWVLDNLKPEIVRLAATRDEYALVRIESSENPRYWTIFREPSVLDHDNPRSNIAIMWLRSAKIAKASSYGYSRARPATMRRIGHFSVTPFALALAPKAHPLAWRVVRGDSKACRSAADPGRFHPRASSISEACAARSRE
jgi:predicted transglutaminase-like cysteine proteinase